MELAMEQDVYVEGDILFYRRHKVWHMIDRCDRFHATTEITDKSTETLCDAISRCWISLFGPFKYLIIDGESGLNKQEAKTFLAHHGAQLRTRAPGQHARILERRGAILRHSMHTGEEQLKKEGITVTFTMLLAEHTFAGNALTMHNGATPYNARFRHATCHAS